MIRDQKKVAVGYLWKKTDSKGKPYIAGTISLGVFGEIPIVIFEEENKTSENAPDYLIRSATDNK